MPLNLRINEGLRGRDDSTGLLLELLQDVDEHARASIRMVAFRREGDPWSLFYCEAIIGPEASPGPCLDLGRVVVLAELIGVGELAVRVREARETGIFRIAGIEVKV